jgi:molybdate transport system substrate-binding protein
VTTGRRHAWAVAAVTVAGLLSAVPAGADDVHVMTSGAFTAALLELIPTFEQATGHRVIVESTSMGVGPTSIVSRLERGDAIDVVIVDSKALERMVDNGQIQAGSRSDLAQSMIGMAVRHGAPKPDISTLDALRATLLTARSIAYSSSVSGTYLSSELFQRLGIAELVLPKSRRITGERVGAVVARGEAEIGFQQISELLPEPGIDFVAALPAEAQHVMTVAAGLGVNGRSGQAARQLIVFLASPAAAPAIAKTALDPVATLHKQGVEWFADVWSRSVVMSRRAVAVERKRAPGVGNASDDCRLRVFVEPVRLRVPSCGERSLAFDGSCLVSVPLACARTRLSVRRAAAAHRSVSAVLARNRA